MIKKLQAVVKSLTFRMVLGVMLLILLMNLISGGIGYWIFTDTMGKEYEKAALHTARTADVIIDGDKLNGFLANGGSTREYRTQKEMLDDLCIAQSAVELCITVSDPEDYGKYTVVFDSINPKYLWEEGSGDSTKYYPWKIGDKGELVDNDYLRAHRELLSKKKDYSVLMCTDRHDGKDPHIALFSPILDSEGEISAILCVKLPMEELQEGLEVYDRRQKLSVAVMTVTTAFFLGRFLWKKFVIPTRMLSEEAKRFSQENTIGDFRMLLDNQVVGDIQEIRELAESVERMEKDTLWYMENLREATANQERISTELSLAARIQSSKLPRHFPPFPERYEFDIFANMTPAKEVGGDFYDFYMLDDDRLAIVMADVSGKGIPAALFMMATQILIKSAAKRGSSPADVLMKVNGDICKTNFDEMFVTVWLGFLSPSTGELIYANAGHEYPAVKHADGEFELVKDRHGFVLGGLSNAVYRDCFLKLDKGDTLFLYTDGVTEATSAANELFGTERILKALNKDTDASVQEMLGNVRNSANEFVGEAEQFDDMTMLCLKMVDSNRERCLALEGVTIKDMETVLKFLDTVSEEWGLPPKLAYYLQIMADEVFSNIAYYSGSDNAVVKLRRIGTSGVELVMVDNGKAYDPTAIPDPDVTLSAEKRKIGGLGMYMVRKMSDEVFYKREYDRNILVMRKML